MISADYTINRNKTRLFVIYCNVVNKSNIYIFFYIQELLQKFMTQSHIHIRIHVELCNTLSFVFFKIYSLKQSVRAMAEKGALPHPPHSTLWFISIHFVGFLGYDSRGCPIGLLHLGLSLEKTTYWGGTSLECLGDPECFQFHCETGNKGSSLIVSHNPAGEPVARGVQGSLLCNKISNIRLKTTWSICTAVRISSYFYREGLGFLSPCLLISMFCSPEFCAMFPK